MTKTIAPRKPETSVRKVVPAADAQAQILAACDELFYREGARAVGIDAVVKHAGVNKMSLYRQFESKDGLLLSYLEGRAERFWALIDASIAKHPDNPAEQLVQILTDIAARAAKPEYRGCPFVNISVEFPDREHPTREFVQAQKAQLIKRLQAIAKAAGAAKPAQVAQGVALLMDGVYAASQAYAPGHPVPGAAPALARMLVAQSCATQ